MGVSEAAETIQMGEIMSPLDEYLMDLDVYLFRELLPILQHEA